MLDTQKTFPTTERSNSSINYSSLYYNIRSWQHVLWLFIAVFGTNQPNCQSNFIWCVLCGCHDLHCINTDCDPIINNTIATWNRMVYIVQYTKYHTKECENKNKGWK